MLGDSSFNQYTMKRVIKFEKENCVPCNMVSAYLDNKGVGYERVNPFENPDLAVQFKVRSVPTVIVTEGEEEVVRIIGYKPEELSVLAAG